MDDAAFNAIDGRVSALETHMEYVRRDLGDIKAELKDIKGVLTQLPTKRELNADRLQWTAIGIGAIALIVTGVIGGLGWLETRAAKYASAPPFPQPILIQLPATPSPHR